MVKTCNKLENYYNFNNVLNNSLTDSDVLSNYSLEKNSNDRYTFEEAIDNLENNEALITNNTIKNANNNINHFQYLAAISVLRYLYNSYYGNKMEISINLAFSFYDKSDKYDSYKATCIRME